MLSTFGKSKRRTGRQELRRNYELYLMVLPVLIWVILFKYLPMYGIQIAFKNYASSRGIWESQWIGVRHFLRFFKSYQFISLLKNTLMLSFGALLFGFPMPILLALLLNEREDGLLRRTAQTITYAPHFLSTVVLCSMIIEMLSPSHGVVNNLIRAFGGSPIYFMTEKDWFAPIYVISGIWQNAGYDSIVYMAALASVDVELYEAAKIDGANKWNRLIHVTLPCLIPTAVIMLILKAGNMMNVGFTKIYLLQNDLNIASSEVISTYVYTKGLLGAEYSFATSVDLFNAVINLIMLLTVNSISRKASEISLW